MQAQIGNTGTEFITLGPCKGRSYFQIGFYIAVAMEKDFAYFVANPMLDEPYKGPVVFVWYDKQGFLNAARVGVNRIIRRIKT